MSPEKQKSPVRYRRILLKLSGEALGGESESGISPDVLLRVAEEIRSVRDLGIELALVVGAGNIFRGKEADALGIHRSTGDYMGMLGTVMNSIALCDFFDRNGVPSVVLTSINMNDIAEPYTIRSAREHLSRGKVVIAAGGTGHPHFTTDTAASLRAVELEADILLKATRVDGVYTSDPEKDSSAERIGEISHIEVMRKQLRVMDLTSVSLCMDNKISIVVFNLFDSGAMERIARGERVGTLIS